MSEVRRKIVFILGLSRVGSTMLDLVLGSNPKFVGLGEIYQVIRPDLNRFEGNEYCTCGKLTQECSFWGVAARSLKENKAAGIEERYMHILRTFQNVYGSDKIMVDSSKLLDVLKTVVRLPDIEVKVIYLIRDVRAWTVSRLNFRKKAPQAYKRNGSYLKRLTFKFGWKINFIKWCLPALTKMPLYYFILWYIQNKQIKNFLERNKIDSFTLGYDELGLSPELMMEKIFEFLEEDYIGPNFCSINSQSHVLIGNNNKADSKRRSGIFYDNRWLYRNEWLLPAALLPNIMKYNAQQVYRNIKKHSIWDNRKELGKDE